MREFLTVHTNDDLDAKPVGATLEELPWGATVTRLPYTLGRYRTPRGERRLVVLGHPRSDEVALVDELVEDVDGDRDERFVEDAVPIAEIEAIAVEYAGCAELAGGPLVRAGR